MYIAALMCTQKTTRGNGENEPAVENNGHRKRGHDHMRICEDLQNGMRDKLTKENYLKRVLGVEEI